MTLHRDGVMKRRRMQDLADAISGRSPNQDCWRKSLRLAGLCHDPKYFVAVPSVESTLSDRGSLDPVFASGHPVCGRRSCRVNEAVPLSNARKR